MLAIHGDLFSFSRDDTSKHPKPIPAKERSLLAQWAETSNERAMDEGRA
jgi:hypothetical protein